MTGIDLRQRLAAILAADAAGYSRLMAADEHATVAALDAARAVFRRWIESSRGRVIDMAGDSVLAVFDTATGAVAAALAIQNELSSLVAAVPEDRRMWFRIGVHLGDVIEKPDGTIYGDGVNIAARLEGLAELGGIAVSDAVRGAVKGKVSAGFEDRGEQQVKNIADPVRVYGVSVERPGTTVQSNVLADTDSASTRGKPSIAVLPFTNMSGDRDQEYFADGITEDVTTDLARMPWLFVIASGSTFPYKGKQISPKSVGTELNVRYLLDGSVRRGGNHVRITARLVDAHSGAQVWAERFDREIVDIFALQDELGRLICTSVGLSVPEAELERARQKHPRSLGAWDRYLLALAALREMTADGFQRAVDLLKIAIELEPDFATAHARLSLAYGRAAYFGWSGSGSNAIGEAQRCARIALSLDANNAFAHEALASALLYVGDVEAAAAGARRAIEIDPSITAAHGTLVNALAFAGLADEAIAAYERSSRLSPRDPDRSGILMGLANALLVADLHADSIDAARKHIDLKPNWYGSRVVLIVNYARMGNMEAARRAVADLLRLVPHFSIARTLHRPMFRRKADVEKIIGALRLAGVPEN